MNACFNSKIDITFKIAFYFIIAASVLIGLYLFYKGIIAPDLAHRIHYWLISILCLTVGVFLPSTMIRSTRYFIEDEWLVAQCGLIKQRILIKDIQSITKSKNLMAGPALSMDRLVIHYGSPRQQLVISPDKPDIFIARLAEQPSATFLDDDDYTE